MSTKTGPREYLEVTLHMEGHVRIVAAVSSYHTTKNPIVGGLSGLNWKDTEWSDLPVLQHVNLDRVLAITHRQVQETA